MISTLTEMDWKLLIEGLTDVFAPRVCPVCGNHLARGERDVCAACLTMMPRVEFDNGGCPEVERMLLGSRIVDHAVSMFLYHRSSPYAEILKDVKYRNSPQIAEALASIFARELLPTGFFNDIDMTVPVPIHSSKLAKRGYNQSLYIASGIESATRIPTAEAIRAMRPHSSQTAHSASERRLNVDGIFKAKPSVAGKAVLLVDDVITTGATMTACCDALRLAGATRVSVLSLGFAGSV